MKHIFSLALTLVYIGVYAQTLDSSTKESFQSVTHKSADGMAENQSVYTCPMHPEVKSDKPGKCPKCGMKIVPKDNGKMHNSHGKMDMDVTDQKRSEEHTYEIQ